MRSNTLSNRWANAFLKMLKPYKYAQMKYLNNALLSSSWILIGSYSQALLPD